MILKIYQNSSKLEPLKEYQQGITKNKEHLSKTLYGTNNRDFKILNKTI